MADFNGDGRRDLVVANQFSANVTVLLGNGNGTFQAPVNYATGQGPMAVAVGDFNGDNRIDLAVANSSTGDISVLLGNGNGTFQAAVSYLAGTGPSSIAVRDLNGDGRLDLAVANRASADVSILFGNGNGTFQDPASELAGVDPVFVAAGDFNNDTRSDLAVANAALFDVPPSVSVILGKQPNGTFQVAADYDAGISPRAVAIADFNKDGRPDLAVANYGLISGTSTTNSSVPILLGQGDGTFANAVAYNAGAGPIAVAVADFNGDTNLDLIVANERANTVSVLFGNGNGSFQAANDFSAGSHPVALAVGEFNGDAKPDVAVVNDAGVLVLLNSCQIGADLGITMTDAPDPVTVGNNLVYTLSVTNNGPNPSLDVSVTNRLPTAVSFVSAVSSQGSFIVNGSVITFSLGVLSNGATATLSITTTAITAGPATNSANVVSATTPDLTPANNTASVVTTVRSVVAMVAADPNASETGPDSGFITISRSGGTVGSLTVGYTVAGSAVNGTDYSALSGSATIPNGAPSTTFAIAPINDTAVEPTETVVLTLNGSTGYVVDSSANSASVSILDNDVPALSISDAVVSEGNAGNANALFTVTLSVSFPQTVTVNFASANGTATAGSDYVATSGQLTFAPGITSQSISVTVLGDTLNEANETFFINLSSPGNATIADSQGVGTVNNDDAQAVLTINDASVLEANSGTTNAVFSVALSAASGQTVTVNYATANGTASSNNDYVATNGVLAFPPGTTIQTLAVVVRGDTTVEPSETILVNLSSAVNAILADSQGVGTIISDDAALSISDVTVTEGNSGTTNAVFTVSLSSALAQTVTVNYATANGTANAGSDYAATSGQLAFPPGTTSQTVAVAILGDGINEANETFFVDLTSPVNATLTDGQGLGTIVNDDAAPTLVINDSSVLEGNAGTANLIFTVSLSATSGQTVTVNYATANGTASSNNDYVATNGVLSFAPGTTIQTLVVGVRGDTNIEPSETFTVNLSSAVNATLADNQGVGTILNDDATTFLNISDASVTEGNSGTANAVFTVSLSAALAQAVTVNYATANGTATAGSDYVAASGLLTFAPGITNQSVAVTVTGDGLNEANETFFVNLSNPTNASIADGQGIGTINNDDPLPNLAINDVTVAEGNSGTVNAIFTISLSPASGQSVSVNFATADGTATAGSDYVATNGTLTFAAGATTLTIPVRVNGDVTSELNETFVVNLSGAVNAGITDGQGQGNISNDDIPIPGLSISDVTVSEGNAGTINAVFALNLSATYPQPVTVQFATANGTATAGSDYVATNGVVTFAPGTTNQSLVVAVTGDAFNEASETFFVNLSNPTNAALADNQGLGAINNDDPLPNLTINNVTVTEGNSGTVNAIFTVSLSPASGQNVTVIFATADGSATAGSDYVATNGTLTFAAGTTAQSITVRVNGDVTSELSESFFVNLSGAVNAGITDGQGQGNISNDDIPIPGLSISDVTVSEGNAGTINAIFALNLTTTHPQPVTVQFATANGTATAGSDYVATNGMVTFAPGTTNQSLAVAVTGDGFNETNETFFVNLSNPTNAALADNQGLGTINNDDPLPALSINNVSVIEGNSGTANAVFTVSLSAASGRTVTVNYASADGTATAGSDYTAISGTLTFPPGTTTQTVPVSVNGDVFDEANETFFVNLSGPANATLSDNQGLGTISSDDIPLPDLSIGDVTVIEGNSGTTNANFTVTLSFASSQTVTVNYATADGTAAAGADFVTTNGVVTFAPGTTTQLVTVRVLGEALFESNESFVVNLSNPASAALADGQGVGTINNDDPFTTLSISDRTVVEGNSGTTNAVFTVTLSAASGQTITVNYATANGTAIVGTDYIAANGTVTFAPGTTSQTIAVPVMGDLVNEGNDTFVVNLSNPANATISDGQGVGTINNDDPAPSISISDVSVFEGNSGDTPMAFTVRLSAASAQSVTVNYATANGTAKGNDFGNTSGTLQFSPGQTQQTITVQISGDTQAEDNETLFVNLSAPVNATLADSEGQGIILNDEGVPTISILDASVAEGDSGTTNAVFTVRLSAAYAQTVTVGYATAEGTARPDDDYLATNGVVNFAPGTTSQTVVVRILGDRMYELNETLLVNLGGSTNGIVTDNQALGTIINNDPIPALSINDVSLSEGNAGASSATFSVQLSAASALAVTASFATANGTAIAGSDHAATNGTVNFAPGTTNQTITVTILGDLLNEADENFFVNLSAPINASISDLQGVGTIFNDDPLPALSLNDVSVSEGNAGTIQAVFTVNLSAPSGRQVTVNYATSDGTATAGSDYVPASSSLTFAPGVTSQTIVVSVSGDLLNEANETFFVNLANAVNATFTDSLGQGTVLNDDPLPGLSINSVTVTEGDSGSANAVFTVSLSPVSGQAVAVNFATANGTAAAGSDYIATSGTVSFPPGTTTRTITVAVLGDIFDEPNETLLVNLSGAVNSTVNAAQGSGTINDDDLAPALAISNVTINEGNAGTSQASFTVSLSTGSGQTVTVNFATANGSAAAGSDYTATSGTVTFTPGSTSQTVTVSVLGDTTNEADETFFVNLSNPVNATISDTQGLGTVLNDDPLPGLSIADVAVTEGNSGTTAAAFTVTLSPASGQTVTVNFATSDSSAVAGSDYTATNNSITFAPGITTQTITVRVNGDTVHEGNELFFVSLFTPVNATVSDNFGLGTINNDDAAPTLSINDVIVTEGDSGSTTAFFAVSLSGATEQAVSVSYQTAAGTATTDTDYLGTNGSLVFPPGTSTQFVPVTITGDQLNEADETFFVNLNLALNATFSRSQGRGTINDDDLAPALAISNVTINEGNAGTSQASFTVSLSPVSGQTVTVNYATGNGGATGGSDYVATSGTVTFTPGTTSQTITVSVLGDTTNEADETFLVNLSNPVNATISDSQGVGTIVNDDPLPGLTIGQVTVTEGNSGTTTAAFTVTLSPASGQSVTVNFATSDSSAVAGSDYAATNNTLTFAPGITTQTITVRVNGDTVFEGNELFFVGLSTPVNAVINGGFGLGTINNDDAAPTLSINDVVQTEGDNGISTASFTVSLSAASDQPASVTYQTVAGTATAGTDYSPTNGSLSFPPGTTSQTVVVAVFGDLLSEANETLFVNLVSAINATFGDSQGQGTINNDDPLPTLTIGDATVVEGNSGTSEANFTVSLSTASGQTVTVNYATITGTAAAGSDYVSTNAVLTFAPGTITQTATVKVIGELFNETDESFFLNLSGAANATISDNQGAGAIINDDPLPTLSVVDVTITEGNSGTVNAVFTVSMSVASGRTVSIGYATASGSASVGSDYVAANGTVTIAPGSLSQTITVGIQGDLLNEANENFFVNLSNPINAIIGDGQATGTINNDDSLPGIAISNVTLMEGNSGSTNAVFTLSLSAASGLAVNISYSTANGTAVAGTDYVSANGLVTFAPGTTSQSIAIAVLGELSLENSETFLVNLSNPTNATITDSQGIGTINNDDSPPAIILRDVAVFEGNSGTANAVFNVGLAAASSLPITVNYATADGTARRQDNDYVRITSTQLQFSPGQTNQTFSVAINGDTGVEANETFFINFSSPVNATLTDSQAVGTILNDDGVPSLSITDVTLLEGNTGTTNAVFSVRLSASSAQVVTVNYATANGTALAGADYLATNGILSFASGTTNQNLAVRIIGDLVGEPNETLSVILSGSINALISDSTGLATVLDNDPVNFLLSTNAITLTEGGTNGFSVRLLSAPANNVTLTVTRASGSTNLNVMAGGTLTFTPANWNVFQPVVISATPDADTNDETATFSVSNGGTIQLVTATGLDSTLVEVRIVGVQLTGGDVIIRFTSASGRSYRVERTDNLGVNPWTAVGGPVSGTGAVVPVTDLAGAGQSRRFYRVVMLPP